MRMMSGWDNEAGLQDGGGAFVGHGDGNPEFEFELPVNRKRAYEPGQSGKKGKK